MRLSWLLLVALFFNFSGPREAASAGCGFNSVNDFVCPNGQGNLQNPYKPAPPAPRPILSPPPSYPDSGGGYVSGGPIYLPGGDFAPTLPAGGIPADACVKWDGAQVPQSEIDQFNKDSLDAYKTRKSSSRPSATVGGTTLTRSPFHSLCTLNNSGQAVCELKPSDQNFIGVNGTNKINVAHANMNFSSSSCSDFNPLKITVPHRAGFTMCIPSNAAWIGKSGGQILQHFQVPSGGSPPAQVNIDDNGNFVVIVRSSPVFGGSKTTKNYSTGIKAEAGKCYEIADSYHGGPGGHYNVWINGKPVAAHTGPVGFGSGAPIQYDFGPYMYNVTQPVQLIFDKIWIAKGG